MSARLGLETRSHSGLEVVPARNICAKESATNVKRPPPAGTICSAKPKPRQLRAQPLRPRPAPRAPSPDPPPGGTADSASPGEVGAGLGALGGGVRCKTLPPPRGWSGSSHFTCVLEMSVLFQAGCRLFGSALRGRTKARITDP